MPIDAGIYGQIQQPQQHNQLNMLAQAMQIKGYQSQMDKADRAEQQQNRLLSVLQSPEFQGGDAATKQRLAYGAGDVDAATKIGTASAAANKDQREAEKAELAMAIDRYQQSSGGFAEIAKNPAAAQQILGQMVQAKIMDPKYAQQVLTSASQAPDPAAFWMQGAQAAISAKDKLTMQIQQQGQQITMRGQDLSQQTALRGQDLSRETAVRGQDLTDTRTREFNATKVEENRLKREAQGTGVKLTEDQGKATGWLVQAENAYKNMLSAGFDKQGNPLPAAKPGVADVIANSPLGGPVGNWLRSPDRQKFVQGASSLSESLLRAATGAGVNKDEAKQKIEELTPQWGEDDATTKQKMAAIPLYIESLKVRAGPGAAKATEIGSTAAPAGGVIKVTNAADYANVPSGATYTTPDGKTRRKP